MALALLLLMAVYCPSGPCLAEESDPQTTAIEKPIEGESDKSNDSAEAKVQDDVESSSEFTVLDTNDEQNILDLKHKEIFESPTLRQNEAIRHFENARFYMSKWDTELAEVELRAAIMYMPDMKVAHRDYCLIAMMRGKPLRSLAEFMMVVGLGEAIPLNEKKQQKLREEASGLHYNKGLKHAAENKWEDAINELLWSKKYTPLDPAVHRSLAFAYASNKDFDKAEEQYKYTLSLNPKDALTHADYAILLSENGKSKEAIDLMAKAVKLKPDAAALHVDLGWMAESKGDLDKAAQEFRMAALSSPKQTALWVHLGNVLTKLEKVSEAKSAFNEALAIDSSNQDALAGIKNLDDISSKDVEDNSSKEKSQSASGSEESETVKFTPLKQ